MDFVSQGGRTMNLFRFLTVATLLIASALSAQQPSAVKPASAEVDPATLSDPLGKKLLKDAYQASLIIKSSDDLTPVIEGCEKALAGRLVEKDQRYAHVLASWAYNRRGEFYAEQAAESAQQGSERKANEFDTLALAEFEEAIKHDAKAWKPLHNRGVSHALHGKLDEALEDFNRVLALESNYANAWFNRAEVLAEQGRFEEAADDYSHAISKQPNDLLSLKGRASCLVELQRLKEALADFNRIIELEPGNADIRCSRGDIQQSLGKWDAAAAEYEQCIKLFPKHAASYRGAAWLMATCPDAEFRNAELAIRTAEKAMELSGKNSHAALDVLAAAHANAARYDLAVAEEKKAIALAKDPWTELYQRRLDSYLAGRPFRQ
jgi:tetratricopeptide (TPR) repeat protein